MNFRQLVSQHQKFATGVAVGLVVISVGAILLQVAYGFGGHSRNYTKEFFSDDDGATYFTASHALIPPFDHNGKMAVAASVFVCSSTGKQFVGYLSRYSKAAHQAIEDANQVHIAVGDQPKGKDAQILQIANLARVDGIEVKHPGETHWVSRAMNAKKVTNIMLEVKCPDGQGEAVRVLP